MTVGGLILRVRLAVGEIEGCFVILMVSIVSCEAFFTFCSQYHMLSDTVAKLAVAHCRAWSKSCERSLYLLMVRSKFISCGTGSCRFANL